MGRETTKKRGGQKRKGERKGMSGRSGRIIPKDQPNRLTINSPQNYKEKKKKKMRARPVASGVREPVEEVGTWDLFFADPASKNREKKDPKRGPPDKG